MAGVPAGRLNIEIVAEVARLQQSLDQVKRTVSAASRDIAKNAKFANDNLASIGKGAGAGVKAMSQDFTRLKASLDPAWASLQRFNEQQKLGMDAFRAGAINREQFIAHMRQINAELKGVTPGMGRLGGSAGQARAGFQQLGFQIGDFATQVSSGTSATQAFAQQIGQTFQAVQLMSGGTSKFATFIGGPWGIALSVGVTALAGLIGYLTKADDKMKKLKTSAEETADAIKDLVESTGRSTAVSEASTKVIRELVTAQADVAKASERITEIQNSQNKSQGFALIQAQKDLAAAKQRVETAQNQLDTIRDVNRAQDLQNAATERARKADEAATKALRDRTKALKDLGEVAQFITPVSGGNISGRFGEQRAGRRHAGLDIAVPVGTSVKAAASGTVIESGTLPGFGNVIFIDHGGGTITRYAHLSKLGVGKGASVGQGDVIGLSGGARGAPGAGNSQGPHLHYEVRRGGKAVDPSTGRFPVDSMGAGTKAGDFAERAAREAEREREQAIRRAAEYANLSAGVEQDMLQSKMALIEDQGELARLAKEQVGIEADKYRASIEAKMALGDLTEAQALQLLYGSAIAAAMKAEKIARDEQRRQSEEALRIETAANDNQKEILGLQEQMAVTQSERRKIQLSILALEKDIERKTLQESLKSPDAATRAAAAGRLGSLDQRYDLRGQSINAATAGPLERYIKETDPRMLGERAEALVVEQLEYVQRGITDAISNALGVQDPLLRGLIEMFIEQVLIRPIAQALQQAQGTSMSGGGGGGGWIGQLLNLGVSVATGGVGGGGEFTGHSLGGGFAKGTNFAPGGMAWVGEEGPELMNVPRGAQIYPADVSARMAAGTTNNISVNVSGRMTEREARETGDQIGRRIKRQINGR